MIISESWSPKFNLVILGDLSYFSDLKTVKLKQQFTLTEQ